MAGTLTGTTLRVLDASGGVMVTSVHWQSCRNEFDFHWVPFSDGLVPHLSLSGPGSNGNEEGVLTPAISRTEATSSYVVLCHIHDALFCWLK